MNTRRKKLRRGRGRAGFTLFELVVAMTVVAILTVASLTAVRFRPETISVEEGANRVAAMARAARAQAIMSGARARLLVNYDPTDTENYLKQLGLVVETGIGTGQWVAKDRGTLLPAGVFVDVGRSTFMKEEGEEVFFIPYPQQVENKMDAVASGGGKNHWKVVGFSPNGQIEKGSNSLKVAVGLGIWRDDEVFFESMDSSRLIRFKRNGVPFAAEFEETVEPVDPPEVENE